MKLQRHMLINTILAALATIATAGVSAAPLLKAAAQDVDVAAADAQVMSKPLKGCYRVLAGKLTESSIDAQNVVGQYKFVLQSDLAGKRHRKYVVSGPVSGSEDAEGLVRNMRPQARFKGLEGEGPHGGHNFGTDRAVGTFSSAGDSIQITNVSCLNPEGIPRLIVGVETMIPQRGTGIFTNVTGGQLDFNLTYDACNDNNNPVATLELISGQVCFATQ